MNDTKSEQLYLHLRDGSPSSRTLTIQLRDNPQFVCEIGFGLTEDKVKAMFTIAKIPVLEIWRLPNRYFTFKDGEDELTTYENALYREKRPSWLLKVPCGLVEIGPRKRVVEIGWMHTPVRFSNEDPITDLNVTKGPNYVHCYYDHEMISALKTLSERLATHPRIWPE